MRHVIDDIIRLRLPHMKFILISAVLFEQAHKRLHRKRIVLRGYAESSPPLLLSRVHLFHQFGLLKKLPCHAEKTVSLGRERHTIPGAAENGDSDLLFQRMHSTRQARL